ncbi:esterase family protein (plasmid) [Rhizobium etli 8C-3]|uniref:Esterase family protein n=2 Tax=Rhizobium TaxID=379 RepID=A0A1L5PCT3_RHIET|nr:MULTISPECIES: alpha/beta hydrolase [Rhizobium]APO78097.1 esterase family protein [Rhizobium etli 8C-3]TCU31053.1 hypothetical protein EV130_101628 [Rhizobium azibense]
MADIIILPGIGGSGETHWQTHWERANPEAIRFQPKSWDKPDLADWAAALEQTVAATKNAPLLVAHSLACLLVVHWQRFSSLPVAGAFLVAVPDPQSEAFPAEAGAFTGPPKGRLRFPSLVVASSNDPYGKIEHARLRAAEWGSHIAEVGALGHINGGSGLEDWPSGFALFQAFAKSISK